MTQTRTLLTTTSLAALTIAASLGIMSIASAHEVGAQDPEVKQERQALFQQARDLREAGNIEEARQLLEDSGIKFRGRQHGERHQKMQAVKDAIANNDYQAFLDATADAPRKMEISETQFSVLVRAHALHEAGDMAGAKTLLDEAGIKPPHHKRHGKFDHRRGQEQVPPAEEAG